MTTYSLTTRAAKGSALTHSEMDANLNAMLRKVNNMADLRTITPVDGVHILRECHTTNGDGGSLEFRGVTGAAVGTYTHNNGNICVPVGGDGSAAWVGITNGTVSLPQFGVFQTVADNQTQLNACLNSGILNIYVPPGSGTYDHSAAITVTGNIRLFGAGMERSVIALTSGTANQFVFTGTGQITIEDVGFSAYGAKTAGTCLTFSPSGATQNDKSIVRRCRFSFQFKAIDAAKTAYFEYAKNHFDNNATNAVLITVNNSTTPDSGDSVIENNWFYGGTNVTHVRYRSSGGLRIVNNKFLQGDYGIDTGFTAGVVTGILTCIGNSFDGQAVCGVRMQNADATASFTDFIISNNVFDGSPTSSFITVDAGAGTMGRTSVTNNTMIKNSGAGVPIVLTAGGNINVSGNVINAASGTGISIAAAVTNSAVVMNMLEGCTVSNSSTTTIVALTETGSSAAFRIKGQFSSRPNTDKLLSIVDAISLSGAACVSVTNDAGTVNTPLEVRCSAMQVTAGTFAVSDSIKSINATAGIGYGTGSGGTVTQATSKSTGVTLNTVCGAITMNAAALAADAIVSFVLTNTAIAATDVLVLNHISGGTIGAYTLNGQCAAGSATINVANRSTGSLSEAVVIQFAVIKAVNA